MREGEVRREGGRARDVERLRVGGREGGRVRKGEIRRAEGTAREVERLRVGGREGEGRGGKEGGRRSERSGAVPVCWQQTVLHG